MHRVSPAFPPGERRRLRFGAYAAHEHHDGRALALGAGQLWTCRLAVVSSAVSGLFYPERIASPPGAFVANAPSSSTQMPFTSAALWNLGRAYLPLYEGYASIILMLLNTMDQ